MSQDETMLGKGVLSRRDCVKLMGGFAIAMGTGSLLAGCSSGTSDSGEGASQSDETPKTLRVAMMGSSTDTLDPATFSTLLPLAIALNVYDSLILLRNGVVENSLAESIEPNEDASAWTVTLKDGVKYHDGETVTAEDALYSLQYAGTSPMYSSFYANVDWEGSSVVDERTFTLQLLSPQATFWDEVVSAVTFVFPAGDVYKRQHVHRARAHTPVHLRGRAESVGRQGVPQKLRGRVPRGCGHPARMRHILAVRIGAAGGGCRGSRGHAGVVVRGRACLQHAGAHGHGQDGRPRGARDDGALTPLPFPETTERTHCPRRARGALRARFAAQAERSKKWK